VFVRSPSYPECKLRAPFLSSSVACLAVLHLSMLSHNWQVFSITIVEYKMCLISSIVSVETFRILGIITRDIMINFVVRHVKYQLFLSEFNEN
jgi:hypothetical protein